jgi:tetratricopeptide (TPR) repeat protein
MELPLAAVLVERVGRDAAITVSNNLWRAAQYRNVGDAESSHTLLHQILDRMLPGFAPALGGLAHGYAMQGRDPLAEDFYRQALAAYMADEPLAMADRASFALCCANLAEVLVAPGRPNSGAPEALALARRACTLRPDHPAGHFSAGVAYVRLGQAPEAMQALLRAYRLQPSSERIRTFLAYLLEIVPAWRQRTTSDLAKEFQFESRDIDEIRASLRHGS